MLVLRISDTIIYEVTFSTAEVRATAIAFTVSGMVAFVISYFKIKRLRREHMLLPSSLIILAVAIFYVMWKYL